MKRIISIILALVVAALCVSCGKDASVGGDSYNFETDFQFSTMQADSMAAYAQSPDGVYTVQGTILRYFENGGDKAVPLCTRPECMHSDWGTNVDTCDAYVGINVRGIEYYNGAIYIAAHQFYVDSDISENGLKIMEYTLQGKYVRTVAYIPDSTNEFIQHRGVFYYVNNEENDDNEIIYTLSYVTADGEESGVIYQGKNENHSIHNPSAYGKYLYFACNEYSENENVCYTMVYDLETKEMTKIDKVQKVYFCDDKLVYVRLENGAIYTSNLDGTNEKEAIELDYVNALLYAYDDVVIASNLDTYNAEAGWVCEFALYKDGKFIRTFTVDDFTGGDWNEKRVTYNMFHTDEYIYMTVLSEQTMEDKLLRFDREEFEKGVFEPVIMDVEATSNDDGVIYED